MKKLILIFLLLLGNLAHHPLVAQEEAAPTYNRLKIKSIGFSAMWGMENYFKPLTFAYFEQNLRFSNPGRFQLPPGNSGIHSTSDGETAPLGLSLQVAWPVGKKRNELRIGFGFQDHWNATIASSYSFPTPDVYRYHSVHLADEYVLSQLTFDYVVYAKPILKVASFFGSAGGTFGGSTRHGTTWTEHIMEWNTDDVIFRDNGFSYAPGSMRTFFDATNFASKVRLQTGIRATAGVEFQLTRFGIPIGLGGFWGYGLVTQKFLNGGTLNHKWTEFAQVQARYFLY